MTQTIVQGAEPDGQAARDTHTRVLAQPFVLVIAQVASPCARLTRGQSSDEIAAAVLSRDRTCLDDRAHAVRAYDIDTLAAHETARS